MSLPELFRHQTSFVGCLSIRRLEHVQRGTDAHAAAELEAFLPRYAQRAKSGTVSQYVFITAQAYNDPLAAKCAALTEDKLCSLQDNGKPLACRSVPLEATLPDVFQLSVLEARAREAEFMGADCIQPRTGQDSVGVPAKQGATAPLHLPVIVEGPRVVDPEAQRALALRRAALHWDRSYWGDRVFEMLRRDLFDHPERVRGLPEQGYLCLSLAPALSVISTVSNPLARRVVEYLSAQIELIALTLGAPVKEPTQAQRELAGMLRANLALRAKLQAARPLPQPASNASEVEAWLLEQRLEAPLG
jgi:hypothetical protein